jgi:hypothetical protein
MIHPFPAFGYSLSPQEKLSGKKSRRGAPTCDDVNSFRHLIEIFLCVNEIRFVIHQQRSFQNNEPVLPILDLVALFINPTREDWIKWSWEFGWSPARYLIQILGKF